MIAEPIGPGAKARGDTDRASLRAQLIGTWAYRSVAIVRADGSREPLFGANPTAMASFDIAASTFANWNGLDQTRPFTIVGDELTWRTPASTGAGTADVVLKRVR